MAENESEISGLKHSINEIDLAPIDEAFALTFASQVCEQIIDGFAINPRILEEKSGDDVSKSLHLKPDLDPGIFVEELRNLERVDIRLEYALSGNDDQMAAEVTIAWHDHNENTTQVTIKEGEAPFVSSWHEEFDGKQSHTLVGQDLNGVQAMVVEDIMKGVAIVLQEQDDFVRDGRGDALKVSKRERNGSVD